MTMNYIPTLLVLALTIVLGVASYLEHKRSHADFMRKLKEFEADPETTICMRHYHSTVQYRTREGCDLCAAEEAAD